MTIKNLYPKSRPQTIYNVINGRPELPAASTFSRASEATYFDANGVMKIAAADEPRFNYDPDTGEFLGLMLEPASKNSVENSALIRSVATDFPDGWSGFNPTALPTDVVPIDNIVIGGGPAWMSGSTNNNGGGFRTRTMSPIGGNIDVTIGAWLRKPTAEEVEWYKNNNDYGTSVGSDEWRAADGVRYSARTDDGSSTVSNDLTISDEWQYLTWSAKASNLGINNKGWYFIVSCKNPADANRNALIYVVGGVQIERLPSSTSFVITPVGGDFTRAAEPFSLTSSSNFDGGFSLLLDSDTTTDDFIYKIKASGTTIAELNNANGTLDWVIDGTSAATSVPPQYPQVGAIQPGRVRTISSFGAADGTTQQNYLYTTGLSFPTNAIVASGANEIEFGPGQTLKAAYLWNGQLSNTEAVSVIKGEYNIVPNEPIKADSYSFVYDTDPTTVGEKTITLPYIVPTVSMRVFWGDGTNSTYEQGVTASHTYPFPGQYRIQIEADDGFDNVRLADIDSSIIYIDQWAPQHRVGADGPGFTGDDLKFFLRRQSSLKQIPPFKYTDLTNLTEIYNAVAIVNANNWDFIPTQLQSCTSLRNAFNYLKGLNGTVEERASFPQLVTSTALTDLTSVFTNTRISQFLDSNGNPTNKPVTVTSNVTQWSGAFVNCSLTDINVDISSATSLSKTFGGNSWVIFPNLGFSNIVSLFETWLNCYTLTGFSSLPDFSSVTNFQSTWANCRNFVNFPLVDTSSGTNFTSTWSGCTDLTSFPNLDFGSAIQLENTWEGSGLVVFPRFDFPTVDRANSAWKDCTSLLSFPAGTTFPVCTGFPNAWRNCNKFTSFPPLDLSSGTNFDSAWRGCTSLASFPELMNVSGGINFSSAWRGCASLTSFPKLNLSSGTRFNSAWNGCTDLANFPDDNSQDMFNTTGILASTAFTTAFTDCALTAQSIENILVSLDTNGQSNIELGIDGGTNAGQSTWTAAANTAYTNLINKGWSITFNP